MAKAVVTFKLMPEDAEAPYETIAEKALEITKAQGAIGEQRSEIEPIAFGLKCVKVLGMFDVDSSDFEAISAKLAELEGVSTAEVAKMDLAMG